MKPLFARAFLLLGVLSTAALGCAATVQDEVPDDEVAAEEDTGAAQQALDGPSLGCTDMDYIDIKTTPCPLPYAPATCTRDCTAYRHYVWVPGSPGSFQCVTYDRTCDSWTCDACY